jgi:hypothetical protein
MMMMGTLECKHLIATFPLRLAISNALYSNRASRSQTLMMLQSVGRNAMRLTPLQVFATDSPYFFGFAIFGQFFCSASVRTPCHGMA